MTTTEKPYRIIGTRPIRVDGIDKVTGRAQYGADMHFPQMLYARLKTSPHAHAVIKRIDTSKALALPGVEAVVTYHDFPDATSAEPAGAGRGGNFPRRYVVGNFIAVEKTLFYGHPVAAVAATSPHIAEDALALIEVEYEVLEPVMTAQRAMEADAPILLPELRTAEPLGVPSAGDKQTNIASHLQLRAGDSATAFAEADIIVEDEFHTGTYHQGYIEPHTATAIWNKDDTLTIYSSSQGSFAIVRDPLATILQMPPSRIRVVPLEIGGGFGGKNRIYCEPLAAMLSKKTGGKPVRLSMTREEVIQATGPTSGTYIRAKMGAKRDGTIVAAELWMAYEAGAFPGSSVGGGVNSILSPYIIPNITIDGYDVVVNRPRNAAYRAPGVPAPTYVVESLIDEIAQRLEVDPMDLRLKNAAKEGDRRPNGVVLGPNGNIEVMQRLKNSPHYRSELSGKNRGRGVAIGFWNANAGQHSINAAVNSDGMVLVNGGAIDIGGLRTTEAMTMAEVLGIPYEDIRVRTVDTDSIGFTGNTGGSGTGPGTSASVYRVAEQIRDRMVERAARIWEVDPEAVAYERGVLTGPAGTDGKPHTMTFKQLASQTLGTGGMISGHIDTSGATGGPTYAGHLVDVEVDTDTGKVTILRYTCVQDVGTAMHPGYVEGQIQGGVAQGIGMALTEEYFYDKDGVLRNNSLLDYRMPTALDLPMLDIDLVEIVNPGHPLGVRGIGETPIVGPMGAVANAIADATGVRVRQMPASPRVLLEALMDQNGEAGGA